VLYRQGRRTGENPPLKRQIDVMLGMNLLHNSDRAAASVETAGSPAISTGR
jgi:hypothetical protein